MLEPEEAKAVLAEIGLRFPWQTHLMTVWIRGIDNGSTVIERNPVFPDLIAGTFVSKTFGPMGASYLSCETGSWVSQAEYENRTRRLKKIRKLMIAEGARGGPRRTPLVKIEQLELELEPS